MGKKRRPSKGRGADGKHTGADIGESSQFFPKIRECSSVKQIFAGPIDSRGTNAGHQRVALRRATDTNSVLLFYQAGGCKIRYTLTPNPGYRCDQVLNEVFAV